MIEKEDGFYYETIPTTGHSVFPDLSPQVTAYIKTDSAAEELRVALDSFIDTPSTTSITLAKENLENMAYEIGFANQELSRACYDLAAFYGKLDIKFQDLLRTLYDEMNKYAEATITNEAELAKAISGFYFDNTELSKELDEL